MKKGFTLLELIVVVGIIALLATTGYISYASLNKSSRDAKRKVDLENIRGALEMYKSNNNTYPTRTAGSYSLPTPSFTDGTNTYLNKIPEDPKPPFTYYYTCPTIANPTGTCLNYTVGAMLENTSTCIAGVATDCDTTAGTQSCNYCLDPLGQK